MNALRSLISFSLLACAAAVRAQSVGSIAGWGDNGLGQLNFPPGLTNVVMVAAGLDHSVALKDDGTVTAWGSDTEGQASGQPIGLNGVRSIAAGDYFTVALRSNGTVVAWGRSDANQTNVPAGLAGVRAIAAGATYALALRSNGTVVAWGYGTVTNTASLVAIRAIAAGANHALALRTNGVVYAWGGPNTWGQISVPVALTSAGTGVKFIAAGEQHSIAVRSNGTFVAWGYNAYGQGNVPASATNVVSLFAGANHSGVVRGDGRIVAWGDNTYGQTNTATISNAIAAVSHANHGLAVALQRPSITTHPFSQNVSVGQVVTLTVVASGSPPLTYQWRKDGTNIPGAFNATYTIGSAQPTNSGGYSVVVANPIGSVTSLVATLTVSSAPMITTNPASLTVAINSNVVFTSAAVGTTPMRFQWRKNGTNINNATNTVYQIPNAQLEHAGTYSVMVTNLYGTATSSNAVLTVVSPPTIQKQPESQTVLAGSSVTLTVVSTNATSIQWMHSGTNLPGATLPMFTINRAQASDAGNYVALLDNGFGQLASAPATLTVITSTVPSEVVLWGQDLVLAGNELIEMAPPNGLANVKAVAAGADFNLALRANGTVVGWGNNAYGQAGLPPGVIATSIVAGAHHTLAITNRRVAAWGLNTSGQATPPDISNVVAVAAAENMSMALRADGAVFVWGETTAGQAVLPPSVTNVMAIAVGVEHCLALRSNGTVVGWAGNTYGQARAPFAVTNVNAGVAAIAAGAFHSIALKSNGTVIAWGRNTFGQTNTPPEATDVIAIAAGADHSLALRRDGTVVCWGNNNYGQIEQPEGLFASAIGAGGARSLAVKRRAFRLLPPARISATELRFEVRNLDGSLPAAAVATNLEVLVSPDAGPIGTNWVKVTNAITVSTNGTASFTDDPSGRSQRFFLLRGQ